MLWRDADDAARVHYQSGHVQHGGPKRMSARFSEPTSV